MQASIASAFNRLVSAINVLSGRVLPSGGTTGQVLAKTSATSYDTSWQTISGGGFSPDIKILTTTQQSTVVALANITSLVSVLVANATYKVTAFVTFQSAATTTGLNLGFTSPAGSVNQLEITVPITSTNAASQLRKTWPNATETVSGSVLGTGVTAINSNHTASVTGLITTGATAGDFQIRFASEVAASAITLQIGSSLIVERIA